MYNGAGPGPGAGSPWQGLPPPHMPASSPSGALAPMGFVQGPSHPQYGNGNITRPTPGNGSWQPPPGMSPQPPHLISGPPPSAPAHPMMGRPPPSGPPQMGHLSGPPPGFNGGPPPGYGRPPPSAPHMPMATTGGVGHLQSPLPQASGASPSSDAPVPPPIGGIQAHTTVFVGSISPGVTDEWIKQLLTACGPLRSFRRVNAQFGFAEFVDPESVLRALAILSGLELPVMGREAQQKPEARKKLMLKADEKTRKYLDQYEQARMKTSDHENDETSADASVKSVLAQMSDPANINAVQDTPGSSNTPSHLKDLPPEDLPEEHRGAVLSEIDRFRQASAARDEERKRRERIQEMERARAAAARDRGPQQGDNAGPRSGPSAANGRREDLDRQSYLRPVGFVAEQAVQEARDIPADERDARQEERRQQREREDAMRASQEAEKRYLASERARLAHWERESSKDQIEEEKRYQRASHLRKLVDTWDQARSREREMFYFDRERWRSSRRNVRAREEHEDDEDRKAQAEEDRKSRAEAERFLAQQAEDMAAFEREQRAAGVLMPNDGTLAPLKLKRATGAAATDEVVPAGAGQVSSGVLGQVDDEGDISGLRKNRLAHIDLTDENDVEAQRERIREQLPSDHEKLFEEEPRWQKLDETFVEGKYKSLLDSGIIESLGEAVPDMVDEVLQKIRQRAPASALIEVVEPVLEEEAKPLMAKLWMELLVDTLSARP